MIKKSKVISRSNPVEKRLMSCPRCQKPEALCVCSALDPVDTKTTVVILQHPQERAEALGTGWLTHCQLRNSVLRVGLSWPSLRRLLEQDVDMKRWGVLYLGAAKDTPRPEENPVVVLGRSGERLASAASILRALDGLIVLDGTWSQAKALWWRNPWLLKAHRLVLNPPGRSRYGKLRREPRRESLAVIEATALALSHLERRPDLEAAILKPFDLLVENVKTSGG